MSTGIMIIGPSGSGKTTLLSLIAGLEKCKEGKLKYKDKDILDKIEECKEELAKTWNVSKTFPFTSTVELGKLFEKLGWPCIGERAKTGAFPTSDAALTEYKRLNKPGIETLKRFRSLNVARNAFVIGWGDCIVHHEDGTYRVHPSCNAFGTKSFRHAMNDPNFQQIPSHGEISDYMKRFFCSPYSREGFEIEDIENNCDLFLNGHLHNGTRVTDKIYNVGNLTGQNFSEDILTYKHNVCILDTETLEMKWVENPHSIGFVKFSSLDAFKVARFELVPELTCTVVRVKEEEVTEARELLKGYLASKLIVAPQEKKENVEHEEQNLGMNHIESFIEFVRETFEPNEILEEELEKVVR